MVQYICKKRRNPLYTRLFRLIYPCNKMESSPVYTFDQANISESPADLGNLIAKAKRGEPGAFAEIYTQYFKKIYRFIYYRVSHKELAEDLSEDVFIKAYHKIHSVSNNSSFEGWLYQIARNLVIDYYRSKKSEVNLEEVENTLEYETNIIDDTELHFHQKQLVELLSCLTLEQQQIVKLKFLENLENAEIAAITRKTEGAIRVIQHRALQKLKEAAKDHNIQLPF
jgi:RNA polymerase sigma-70 factor (ECF subfamily)